MLQLLSYSKAPGTTTRSLLVALAFPVLITQFSSWAPKSAGLFEHPVAVGPAASSSASWARRLIRWFSCLCGLQRFAGLQQLLRWIGLANLLKHHFVFIIELIRSLASGDDLQDFALSFDNQKFDPQELRSWQPQHSICSSKLGYRQSSLFHLLWSYPAGSQVCLIFSEPQTAVAVLLRISGSWWYSFRISWFQDLSGSFTSHSFGTQVF